MGINATLDGPIPLGSQRSMLASHGECWKHPVDLDLPNGAAHPTESNRVEIYGLSSFLPPFLKNPGTPVKFLRYITLPEPKTNYRAWVATTCMTDFWFRYDISNGKARYALSPYGQGYWLNY